jgi:hypothetical protein
MTRPLVLLKPLPPRLAPLSRPLPRHPRALVAAACVLAATTCVLASGCGTVQPGPISARELAQVQTFPYFRVYWVGRHFGSHHLTAADGLKNYSSASGESVYYGACTASPSSALSSKGCELPLEVTTMVYPMHSNAPLGSQRNVVLRGVPAVIFNAGSSIQLYSGRLAIEILADSPAEALRAVYELRPVNAPGSASRPLPAPASCPLLFGPQPPYVRATLRRLPGDVCRPEPLNSY